MRFQAAHKLVTYLLVLSALAALATTHGIAPVSALAFLLVCAVSFAVDSGARGAGAAAGAPNRWATALDRSGAVVRGVAGVLLVAIVWRIGWMRSFVPGVHSPVRHRG